jgi:hypothetical protein
MNAVHLLKLYSTIGLALLFQMRDGQALVSYDQGHRVIRGVQLLPDANDKSVFYYLPQYPRLATKEDGTFEFLCLKYTDSTGTASGGLLHALIEFSLPPDLLESVEKDLLKQVPGARIAGPVPLMQATDAPDGSSFQVVSAVLSDREKGGFTKSVVTSGKAPLTPGSKAVVAAALNHEGATLLWDSFRGNASDVSIAIHACYEAAIEAYNARVTADVNAIYTHFSQVSQVQKDYTRRQMRNVVDDLQRNQILKVEVLDRTAGTGLQAKEMDALLNLVTGKLTELMFDHKTGWAKDPEREAAVEANQLLGRQQRGWFSETFGGAEDTKYYTDDQWVLKNRKDIQHNTFSLILSKSSTIKVPLDTAGNLGGLYKTFAQGNETNNLYFRIVNLSDPAFELRNVHFYIDGEFVDGFENIFNFVTVNFRKQYETGEAPVTKSITFDYKTVKAGKVVDNVTFPRLGVREDDWKNFEYQIRWSIKGGPTLSVPADGTNWIKSQDPAISLTPPVRRHVVGIESDRQVYTARKVSSGVLEVAVVLAGHERLLKQATLRSTDAESISSMVFYHDPGTPVAYRMSWYSNDGSQRGKLRLLDSDYLNLTPPLNQ